jgi:hypothetical protein
MTAQSKNIFINIEFLFDYVTENYSDKKRFSIDQNGIIKIVNF